MTPSSMPKRLFAQPVLLHDDPVGDKIARAFSEDFDIKGARLGDLEGSEFIAAIAKGWPTILQSRSLARALSRVDDRPAVICSEFIDPDMKRALAGEGIPYIKDVDNAFLPFLGAIIWESDPIRAPKTLTAQAQRIFLNLLAGRWDGLSAGELAERSGMSNASVTKYLAEIKAVDPSLITWQGKRRLLKNPGLSKEELLDAFEPYLSNPAKRVRRLANPIPTGLLDSYGAKLAGESALAYFSDLAHNSGKVTVAVDPRALSDIKDELGDLWAEAQWFEEAPLVVEEWPYPTERSTVSCASAGIGCIDPESLYAAMVNSDLEDVRLADALNQLKEEICR